MRQQQALPEARLSELETRWAEASLHEAEDANVLADRWETLPKPLKSEPRVVIAYADRAAELRWEDASARSIEQALDARWDERSEEHTSELQSLMRISYAVFCLKKKKKHRPYIYLLVIEAV